MNRVICIVVLLVSFLLSGTVFADVGYIAVSGVSKSSLTEKLKTTIKSIETVAKGTFLYAYANQDSIIKKAFVFFKFPNAENLKLVSDVKPVGKLVLKVDFVCVCNTYSLYDSSRTGKVLASTRFSWPLQKTDEPESMLNWIMSKNVFTDKLNVPLFFEELNGCNQGARGRWAKGEGTWKNTPFYQMALFSDYLGIQTKIMEYEIMK
ncbi:MAG: hypothetical protein WA705_00425 [Candidatus Ozemobacteraceae bacterium]